MGRPAESATHRGGMGTDPRGALFRKARRRTAALIVAAGLGTTAITTTSYAATHTRTGARVVRPSRGGDPSPTSGDRRHPAAQPQAVPACMGPSAGPLTPAPRLMTRDTAPTDTRATQWSHGPTQWSQWSCTVRFTVQRDDHGTDCRGVDRPEHDARPQRRGQPLDPSSDLSRINAGAGRLVTVGPLTVGGSSLPVNRRNGPTASAEPVRAHRVVAQPRRDGDAQQRAGPRGPRPNRRAVDQVEGDEHDRGLFDTISRARGFRPKRV